MKVDYVVNSEDGSEMMPLKKLRDLKALADKRLEELRQIKILIDNWSSSEADLIATIYTLVLVSKDIEEIPG